MLLDERIRPGERHRVTATLPKAIVLVAMTALVGWIGVPGRDTAMLGLAA